MSANLINRIAAGILCLSLVGCATVSSPTALHLSYSPLVNPPVHGKGRMLVHPFADSHAGGPEALPGARDPVVIAPEKPLAKVMAEAFADAGRFAGYEVALGADAPAYFKPDVIVDAEVQVCQLSADHFEGIALTSHQLVLQVRMTQPGQPAPVWSGNITGRASAPLGKGARATSYEGLLRDSANGAVWEWVEVLNPASADELRARQSIANTGGPVTIR